MRPADKTIHVLLVDDHEILLWGLRSLINNEAPRMEIVGIATDLQDALSKYSCTHPDVVLLDLDLNRENALDLLPLLLTHNRTRVLALTGTREQKILDDAILHGAHGILLKSAPAAHVIKAIDKIHHGELWVDQATLARVFGQMRNSARTPKPDAEEQKHASLTAREKKIIGTMVEQGGTVNKMLAQRLFISEHTLRNHLTSIYQKLGVANRLELYVYAVKHGLGAKPEEPAESAALRPRVQQA